MLDGPVEQIIDSTPMLGAAATQDTVRLVRHGVKQAAGRGRGGRRRCGRAARSTALEFDYARPNDKPDCRWREKAERERMLTRVAQDAERALRAVEQADGLLDDEAIAEAHRLLRELIGQDFDIDDDGVPRLHRGTRSDRIISTVDPEMRHGRKSAQQRFDGYKLSATVTNTAEPLITAVDVAPAHRAGRAAGQAAHRRPAQGRRPQRVLGDTAYGNGPVRAELAERDVDVLAPVPSARSPRAGSASATSGSISTPARSPAPPATALRSAPSRPDFAARTSPRQSANCPLRTAASARPRRDADHSRARRRATDRRPPSA